MLYQQKPMKFGECPVVLRTGQTGKRASQLMTKPGVQRVTKGVWAMHPEPLTAVERSLLLQQHLGAPGSTLAVTGFNALDLLKIPVGYTDHWVWRQGWGCALPAHKPKTPRDHEHLEADTLLQVSQEQA